VAWAGTSLAVVKVEPWLQPAGADIGVSGEPTAAADTGADAAASEAGRWGHDGTPSGTLEGHY
jgi:hypothetical protein